MPYIAVMGLLRRHRRHGFPNGSAPITDRGLPVQPVLLHLPQQQDPALSIHRHWTGTGPDRPTVHIDDIEVGFPTLAAIQFIQRQRPLRLRRMASDPVLGRLACALNHGRNLAQAHALAQQSPQALLDASIAGMTFEQQGQNRALQRTWSGCSLGWRSKSRFQARQPFGFPTVEGLASDPELLTQSTDESIAPTVGHQRADPLCVVMCCARMYLDHGFLLGGNGDVLYQPYLPGSFLATAASHTVTSFSLVLNLALLSECSPA